MAEELYAILDTSKGPITIQLFPNHAPKTVRNFVELAEGTREWTDPTTGKQDRRQAVRRAGLPPRDPGLHDPGRRPARLRHGRPRLQVRRRDPPRAAVRPPVPAGDGERRDSGRPRHERLPVLHHRQQAASPQPQAHDLRRGRRRGQPRGRRCDRQRADRSRRPAGRAGRARSRSRSSGASPSPGRDRPEHRADDRSHRSRPAPARLRTTSVPTCYRHPDRETYVRCQRCNRPICPECQIPAAVGVQCPDDVREGNKSVRQARTTLGGVARGAGTPVTIAILAITVVVSALAELGMRGIGDELAMVPGSRPTRSASSTGSTTACSLSALVHGELDPPRGEHVLALGARLAARAAARPGRDSSALYVVGAVGGSAASYALNYPIVDGQFLFSSVGASGAIFALLGAMLPVMRGCSATYARCSCCSRSTHSSAFQFPQIDWKAHLGGLARRAVPRRRARVRAAGAAEPGPGRRVRASRSLVVAAVVIVRTAQLTG